MLDPILLFYFIVIYFFICCATIGYRYDYHNNMEKAAREGVFWLLYVIGWLIMNLILMIKEIVNMIVDAIEK